ncbi:putative leucine-rich repeat receptor-like protein kinase At2g19210 isoform X5 [Amborella trichopoda]|uniref:putative leucine-rich repeat receptor-like protein kinase At2g19210 isoform X5 n=1 Tax=Amborella trichopoda TaxID=13333 RepID=UPI0009BED959|nr:putative leucine-rich repeat receptor-like protein kinase At2g19210 isoform X5 [Amborella trichopoda]|eukprot:XP_020528655.1 putative leucine-rich repeat receptor-like protein kinase At2g19210 isoform X5 [Amborella trichopoda]
MPPALTKINYTCRYEKDPYDRCWRTPHLKDQFPIYSSNSVSPNSFQPPSSVMQTAVRPSDLNASISFGWTEEQLYNWNFYFAFHFSELEVLNTTELREFNIFIDDGHRSKDDPWNAKPVNPGYLTTISIYTTGIYTSRNGLSVSINKTRRSTHPPILNAFEMYSVSALSLLATYQQDVDALMDIKKEYALKGWLGDPCLPKGYSWDVLICSNAPFPRIISLNLANNRLNGAIPEFLANLPNLVSLDLRDNNLSGPVPRTLLYKNNSGSLFLSIEGNPRLCLSNSCDQSGDSKLRVHKRHQKVSLVVIIASSLGGVLVIVSLLVMVLLLKRRKLRVLILSEAATVGKGKLRSSSTMSGSQAFTYSEIVSITNNFQNAIGRGGYGTVFHGCLKDGRQVAVKMRSDSSRQGLKQFMAEIELSVRVHHKYLNTFLGFCEDGNNMILIYEYMSNGNLQATLSDGNSSRIMNWEQRLKIALGAAQGLEYLHCGCKPPIIHRDVKTSNILLNERMEAKLADFGLSKAWPNEVDTHISTAVVGTPGYVDPEYYITNKLNEKSDVYSFGIVLLEILSGQPSIIIDGQTQERIHIVQWITPNLEKGDIQSVVDRRMQGGYDMNSVWKVAEIAMACTQKIGIKRPTMSEVVNELKGSLNLEFARSSKTNSRRQSRSQPMNSSDPIEFEDDSLFYPSPR